MKDRIKHIVNNIIELIKIVVAVTICGLIAVLFGKLCVWLLNLFNNLLWLKQ